MELNKKKILQENVLQSARALGFGKKINLPNRQLKNPYRNNNHPGEA